MNETIEKLHDLFKIADDLFTLVDPERGEVDAGRGMTPRYWLDWTWTAALVRAAYWRARPDTEPAAEDLGAFTILAELGGMPTPAVQLERLETAAHLVKAGPRAQLGGQWAEVAELLDPATVSEAGDRDAETIARALSALKQVGAEVHFGHVPEVDEIRPADVGWVAQKLSQFRLTKDGRSRIRVAAARIASSPYRSELLRAKVGEPQEWARFVIGVDSSISKALIDLEALGLEAQETREEVRQDEFMARLNRIGFE